MQTFNLKSQTNHEGHLIMDIETPFTNQELELVVIINPIEKGKKQEYDFSDLVGKLKWQGDPLLEQKKIRNEWE